MVITEEFIEECKRRYPIGTTFKSAYSGDLATVKNHEYKSSPDRGVVFLASTLKNEKEYFVYYNGIWAEIVSLPEINSFEIW